MLRLGLCCTFRDQPIKFANTTIAACAKLERSAALTKLSALCLANAEALAKALGYCAEVGIGCFRVNSQILPIKTHLGHGYQIEELPAADTIIAKFKECGAYARAHDIRTCFHPDQFVVLNSRRPEVVDASIRELEYQAEVAEWIGADVVNIHGGGAFGDKAAALADFARTFERLSPRVQSRLTVENDDKIFTPADLLPLCTTLGIPLVYDVHHHRCCKDQYSEDEATALAVTTWNREPMFHLSSPLEGWTGPKPERHHDFIDVRDVPRCWHTLNLTVEVEAKAKEAAVLKLRDELRMLPRANAKKQSHNRIKK